MYGIPEFFIKKSFIIPKCLVWRLPAIDIASIINQNDYAQMPNDLNISSDEENFSMRPAFLSSCERK